MVFKKQSKAPVGPPTSDEIESIINIQDPVELAASEDFFGEDELVLDIEEDGADYEETYEVDPDGFGPVHVRKYGEALVNIRRVKSPKHYGADGKEVDEFTGWQEPKREILEIEVPQRLIDAHEQLESNKIHDIKQQSAQQLNADVRACMAQFEQDKVRQAFERSKQANKRLMEENRRRAAQANKTIRGLQEWAPRGAQPNNRGDK